MSITLYIVRHAKAEDRATFMADHDRQLTSDGIMAAARMGRYLHGKAILPDVIISSTAPRAKDTAKVMAEQIGLRSGADSIWMMRCSMVVRKPIWQL